MEMKTIIVINDNTARADHAAMLALTIAQKANASIILANEVKVAAGESHEKHAITGNKFDNSTLDERHYGLLETLQSHNGQSGQNNIDIREIDISEFVVDDLSAFIIRNNIWLIVKGSRSFEGQAGGLQINIQYVLNKVMCPLLLVPASCKIKDFEHIAYIADLRYCRLPVVRYVAEFAEPYDANLYIDHLSAKGLPNMDEQYALSFFNDEFKNKVNYDRLFFNNIRERDIKKAVDVMINGMHVDLLAFVNHRFHFEEILGRMIPDNLPDHLNIPLLIFPY
jgi:hypothetical protein